MNKITYISSTGGIKLSSNFIDFNLTAGAGEGRMLVACIGLKRGSNVSVDSIDIGDGPSFTRRVFVDEEDAVFARSEIWDISESEISSGTHLVSVNLSAIADEIIVFIIELNGVDQTVERVVSSSAERFLSNYNSTGIIAPNGNAFVIDAFSNGEGESITEDAGQIQRIESFIGNFSLGVSTKELALAGETNLGWSYSNSSPVAHALALYEPPPEPIFIQAFITPGDKTLARMLTVVPGSQSFPVPGEISIIVFLAAPKRHQGADIQRLLLQIADYILEDRNVINEVVNFGISGLLLTGKRGLNIRYGFSLSEAGVLFNAADAYHCDSLIFHNSIVQLIDFIRENKGFDI